MDKVSAVLGALALLGARGHARMSPSCGSRSLRMPSAPLVPPLCIDTFNPYIWGSVEDFFLMTVVQNNTFNSDV